MKIRILALLACLYLLSGVAFAQDPTFYRKEIEGWGGTVVPVPTVTVCTADASLTTFPCTPKATISSPATNPFQGDAQGNIQFSAPAGVYVVSITAPYSPGYSFKAEIKGSGSSYTSGAQYINAAGPPYNLVFDGGSANDGVITNGSTILTSATAKWSTNATVGQRIWGVESSGGNAGKLAFMGTISSIDSNTQIHVSQTSVCNTAAPCTSIALRWGTGGQNTAAQAFIADIANLNVAKPTCGVLPPGGFVWEAAWNGYPAFDIHDPVCLKSSSGNTILYPTPDFGFTPGGQISFANSITHSQFTYGNFLIDGDFLTTTDGRTAVFQGIGGGASCLFLSQIYSENLGCINWGSGVSNWQCAILDNYQVDINLQCINAGETGTQGAFAFAPVNLVGGEFSDPSNGVAGLKVGTPTVTSHVNYGRSANTWRCVEVTAVTTWTSTQDTCGEVIQEAIVVNAAANVKINQANIVGATGKSVIVSVTGTKLDLRQSIVTAQSGQVALDTSNGGIIVDGGGNTITGGNNDICVSAGGTCGTAHSGSVTIAAAATTVTVATTAVTATSKFALSENATLGTPLSVTCNTATNIGAPFVSAITAGTSFVITVPVTPATNPACLQWTILNQGE